MYRLGFYQAMLQSFGSNRYLMPLTAAFRHATALQNMQVFRTICRMSEQLIRPRPNSGNFTY